MRLASHQPALDPAIRKLLELGWGVSPHGKLPAYYSLGSCLPILLYCVLYLKLLLGQVQLQEQSVARSYGAFIAMRQTFR
jgi:hypothetical protein